jgi:hypothetical protein
VSGIKLHLILTSYIQKEWILCLLENYYFLFVLAADF